MVSVSIPDISVNIPEIFPTEEITVENEAHTYDVYEGDFNDFEEDQYILNKAPIKRIKKVTGTANNLTTEFEKGVDYELSADSTTLVWLNGDRPDDNTEFYVTYTAIPILGRYVDSNEEEFDSIEGDLEQAIKSKFISTAEGEELDQIGRLFGPVIGKRSGRTDQEYRVYLESVVQSFISRGTKSGIKIAISAATNVPIDDITITEDFQNNTYSVIVIPNTAVRGSTIEDIAEIADPSGVNLSKTRFRLDEEEIVSSDSVSKTIASKITEDVVTFSDTVSIPAKTSVSDTSFVNDSTQSSKKDANDFKWADPNQTDEDEWSFMQWTEIVELPTVTTTDSTGSTDTTSLGGTAATTTDTSVSDDTVSDITVRSVEWGTEWGTMYWAGETN